MMARMMSISKMSCLPCNIVVMRSRPMPVSMDCLGMLMRAAVGQRLSNCMNTLFQELDVAVAVLPSGLSSRRVARDLYRRGR